MEFRGTPGPWQTADHYEDCLIVVDSRGYEIVTAETYPILSNYSERLGVGHWSDDERGSLTLTNEEQAANAHLIAAAPDLLEALQNMIGAFDNPIVRRKLPSDFNKEAIESARAAISKALGEA